MAIVSSISKLPNVPAVYVLFGGKEGKRYVVYVGIADKLKRRIAQHLITRDSSVATRTSAAGLNPDYVTELRWWEHQKFSDRNALIASELIAFDYFQPALRSRGNVPKIAAKLYHEQEFRDEINKLFNCEPSGRLVIPTLQDAVNRIEQLEKRIEALEAQSRISRTRR
jgi:predicted GIY-YIG superfamily endonuclease